MCSQHWPLSQQANKPKGSCNVCLATHQLHLKDNTVHLHGPRFARCLGSNRPPLSPRAIPLSLPLAARPAIPASFNPCESQLGAATSSIPFVTASSHVLPAPQSQTPPLPSISHPSFNGPIIKHVPKSSRPACCSALSDIFSDILRNKEDPSAWFKLFNFCPSILSVPPKSGSSTSVASLIKARLSGVATTSSSGVSSSVGHRKSNQTAFAAAVSSKVEDGNIKAALRLLCSEDKHADFSDSVFLALSGKHPPAAPDRHSIPRPDCNDFSAFRVSEGVVLKALKTFPSGSSGGPDGFRPQHLLDLVSCKTGGPSLLTSLTGFVNLILDGGCPTAVRPILFGARLIAIEKKSGGIRPIAVGYTLRRLAAKCANTFAQEQLSGHFSPLQLGVAISGGCEAAIHATRHFLSHMSPDEVVVKLDFSNAFNSVRRDVMLNTVSGILPQVYKFCWSAYSGDSVLQFGNRSVFSSEGVQQGDPIGPLLFCLTLHPLLSSLSSKLKIGYLDDLTIGGDLNSVCNDVSLITSKGVEMGLHLNEDKCEFIKSSSCPPGRSVSSFTHVLPSEAFLLGAPLLQDSALDKALSESLAELSRGQSRLKLISAHDALILLKASLSLPRLIHLLRASHCSSHPFLSTIDNTLRSCISLITNTDLSDDQWSQANLPVKAGGLGVRLASHIAPSAFLASVHATRILQTLILEVESAQLSVLEDAALKTWSDLSDSAEVPSGVDACKQQAWDKLVVKAQMNRLIQSQSDEIGKARLLAASAPHSGDWLQAIPISNCGLRLDDDAVRVAVGLRLGTRLCAPHSCICNASVDPYGLHSLSCKMDSARILRHNALNDIIHRSLIRASVPAIKEPPGLLRSDGKRPDGATQIPWASGKCLTWDVTVTHTLASSFVALSASSAANAAERAASSKIAKYSNLTPTHEFVPIAIETLGPINKSGLAFLVNIGRRLSQVTDDPRETAFLFQRLSICLQRYNALSLRSTFGNLSDCDL